MNRLTIDRRTALKLGGAGIASGLAASRLDAVTAPRALLILDPGLPGALQMAQDAQGRRVMPLEGDPIRFWRDAYRPGIRSVEGITRWSDYVALRGLVGDAGLRIRREIMENLPQGLSIVRWSAA